MAAAIEKRGVHYVLELKGQLKEQADKAGSAVSGLQAKVKANTAELAMMSAGVVALGVALVALINDVTSYVDNINTLASATGLAADTIKGLEFTARYSGKSLEDLVPRNFAKNMEDARNGTGKAADGFKTLGMTMDLASGKYDDNNVLLLSTIDALYALEDTELRAATASEIFGKQGEQMLSAFSETRGLRETIELGREFGIDVGPKGAAVTSDWQKATAEFSIGLDVLKQSLMDVFNPNTLTGLRAFGAAILAIGDTYVSVMAKIFTGTRVNPFEEISSAVDTWRRFTFGLVETADATETTTEAVDGLTEAVDTVSDAVLQAADSERAMLEALGLVTEEITKQTGKASDLQKVLSKPWDYDIDVNALESSIREAGAIKAAVEQELADKAAADAAAANTAKASADADAAQANWDSRPSLGPLPGAAAAQGLAAGLLAGLAPVTAPLAALESVPGQLDRLTQSVDRLPETLISIPNLAVGLLDALTELPMELLKILPELALSLSDVIFTAFTYGFEAFAIGLAEVVDLLPGKIAGAVADGLRSLFSELNPFDGDGKFGFGIGAKVEDFIGTDVPFLSGGGRIAEPGLAVVHRGEDVVPSNIVNNQNRALSIGTLVVPDGDPSSLVRRIAQAIGPTGSGAGLLSGMGI